MEEAAEWYDTTDVISEAQRVAIGRTNALRLFGLDLE
jgi:predicted TIM-barrel fold metal-dependent hydrolase